MFKLIKYEFRKNMLGIGVVLALFAILQGFFMVSCMMGNEENTVIGASLLMIAAVVSYFLVFIFGIVTYSKELSSKTSYLIFMTPNTSIKIILSKLLFTLCLGVVIVLLIAGMGMLDLKMMMNLFEEEFSYIDFIKELLVQLGVNYMEIIYSIVGGIFTFLVVFFMTIVLGYFSITLSATVLQNKRIQGLISGVLFILILVGTTKISSDLIPHIYDNPANFTQAIVSVLPSTVFHLVVMVAATFGTAALLDRKISL